MRRRNFEPRRLGELFRDEVQRNGRGGSDESLGQFAKGALGRGRFAGRGIGGVLRRLGEGTAGMCRGDARLRNGLLRRLNGRQRRAQSRDQCAARSQHVKADEQPRDRARQCTGTKHAVSSGRGISNPARPGNARAVQNNPSGHQERRKLTTRVGFCANEPRTALARRMDRATMLRVRQLDGL